MNRGRSSFMIIAVTALLALLVMVVSLTAAVAEAGSLADVKKELETASSLDQKLSVLYDASVRFSSVLENGGWDQSLDWREEKLPDDLLYTIEELQAMPKEEMSISDFEDMKFICLYREKNWYMNVLADFQVRLPEKNRAASVEEADAVVYLVKTSSARGDYTGNAFDIEYRVYVFRRGGDKCCLAYETRTTPPTMGYGTLSGSNLSNEELWAGARTWFYGTIVLTYPEGKAVYRVTGNTCCLADLAGEFTRYEIPESVQGYPVTGIENISSNKTLEELVLPEGIEWIQEIHARYLKRMNFPSTLRRITGSIPYEFMEETKLNEGLEELGEYAVQVGRGADFTLPSTLKVMKKGNFRFGVDCPILILPESLTKLEDDVLDDSMLGLFVPAGITRIQDLKIGDNALMIFTPEGSAAARLAEKQQLFWTPCASPEDLPQAYYGEENDYRYGILGDEAILIKYTGDEENIRVPDTLGGYPVTQIRRWAFVSDSIRTIVIPETVIRIQQLFIDSKALEAVYIPASVVDDSNFLYRWQWEHSWTVPFPILYVAADSPFAERIGSDPEYMNWTIWEPGTEPCP